MSLKKHVQGVNRKVPSWTLEPPSLPYTVLGAGNCLHVLLAPVFWVPQALGLYCRHRSISCLDYFLNIISFFDFSGDRMQFLSWIHICICILMSITFLTASNLGPLICSAHQSIVFFLFFPSLSSKLIIFIVLFIIQSFHDYEKLLHILENLIFKVQLVLLSSLLLNYDRHCYRF